MRLLLIDDDEPALEVLARQLTRHRFAVDMAVDARSAQEYVALFDYALVLLDVSLPDLNGIHLCQRLRAQGYTMPILIVTGRDRSIDKVEGLNAGADDYVVKPFNLNELIARIHALLRRRHQLPPVLHWGDLSLNSSSFEVTYRDQELTLTPKEFGILELLLRAPSQVRSPGLIIESLWADEDPPHEDVVRTHVKGLRQKLKRAGAPKDLIETVYGLGYRLNKHREMEDPTPSAPELTPDRTSTSSTAESSTADNADPLAQTWQIYGPLMRQRVQTLESWVIAAQQHSHSPEQQHQAQAEAHKLVGSLGSFGFTTGSTLAQRMERLLSSDRSLTAEHLASLQQWIQALHQELSQTPALISPAPNLLPLLSRLVILGDEDSDWLQHLIEEAHQLGIEVDQKPFPLDRDHLQALFNVDERPLPDGVILTGDLCCSKPGLQILADLRQTFPQLGLLVILPEGGLAERVQVVRQGADRVVQEPVLPEQVIRAASQLAKARQPQKTVMIVDDDLVFLATLQALLEPWPFQLRTHTAAAEFWIALQQTPPDLVVLDIEMPGTSGLDLCQVLRSDPQWQSLPILFLTQHGDPETQRQAYAMGADDLLIKPVEAEQLAERILNRLRRVR